MESALRSSQASGIAVSAKRYVVYARSKNEIEIIKPSEHGLGIVFVFDKRPRYKPLHCKDQETDYPRWVMCGLGPRSSQGHFLRAAASIITDTYRRRPCPGRRRREGHRNRATCPTSDARPAGVGLGEIPGVRTGDRNAGKVQLRASYVLQRDVLGRTGHAHGLIAEG